MINCRENAHILRVCSAFLDKLSFNLTSNLKSRGLSNDLEGTTVVCYRNTPYSVTSFVTNTPYFVTKFVI